MWRCLGFRHPTSQLARSLLNFLPQPTHAKKLRKKLYFLHMWRCLGFRHPTSQLTRSLLNFLPQPTHAITWHLAKFRDFRTSYGFYIILKHFSGKSVVMLREQDAWKFDASSWIETQHAPINMNNIFQNTTLQYSMHLQFKFDIFEKNQRIEIN